MVFPPIALGTGLFLLLRGTLDLHTLGWSLVIVVNALFTLAFSLRILVQPVSQQMQRFHRLNQSLGLNRYQQWRWAIWPDLRRPVAYAFAVSTTLSTGDMGVIALFGTENLTTLPLLIYRLLGSYRLDQAAMVAFVLCALCFLMFVAIEKGIGGNHA